ncbi:MAG TPA: carboxypeptidase regulatory-like domain-containing protein [Candidatus Acidoferrales bacterium]|nr:carboxypeptidase regulatory-like domain-containing protein [Candidatus Acidoferrales bacterium]
MALTQGASAQQTLGGITGTVTDESGAVIPGATVTAVGDQTKLTRTAQSSDTGAYLFTNLPIGTYTITVTHTGFDTLSIPMIQVQADRTATVNAMLKIGEVGQTVTVEETPLVNAVDTTNGYVLEKQQLENIPLPTGSFTGVAILSPGVNAELSPGTGANAGLGNQPIWANGQRDTSNSFLLNGVDASNLFNGKSTSSVPSARIVNNTGIGGASSTTAEVIQSSASPYLAIGQALPTPAPEMLTEVRVNTSMYDAQQGSTSGAHIDMSTASGTNQIHGSAYVHRGTDWLNAAPYFFKDDTNIPLSDKVPQLHRYLAGGTLGGPLKKDKLFGYVAYQHLHDSDQEIGTSRLVVPFGLNSTNRTAAGLAAISNANFGTSLGAADINPIALKIMQFKLPNGQYMIPNDDGNAPTLNFPENAIIPGTAYFIADQVTSNIDYIVNSKDTLALKYYYQHDPTTAPFAYSSVPGFNQHLDAGSQVASINNTQTLSPNMSVTETFGFIREKIYSTIGQPFTPQQLGINTFGSTTFPGITILDMLGNNSPNNVNFVANAGENIGMGAQAQSAFTGVFQNRWMPSASATWTHGKHTVTFGGAFAYTQLNARDERPNNAGMVAFADFSQFLQGLVTSYTSDGFITTAFTQGNANRYYRADQTGEYVQDKFQFKSNLSITAGIRFDWNGGLTEKNGKLFNFDPSKYSYNDASGQITSTGFIVAGNNPQYPTAGVSNTTLTGRQWGVAPRIGIAWSPKKFNDKVVVRAGWGIYYDRGELFSYLSPGFAAGVIAGGPFGVNQSPPWVNSQVCSSIGSFYEGFIPTCDPTSPTGGSFANPWGATLGPAPTGNPANIGSLLPNQSQIVNGSPLFSFGVYNRANKLPYTMNQTLDIQWQPRNDLAFEIGYVGNLGRHEIVPLPFNQAGIASPSHPIHGQTYTYGYQVVDDTFTPINLPNGQPYLNTYEGGNIDLRVPYVGYSAESESYTAAGISAYNALQTHVEKRLSHGLQVGFSYTYSHALDEQSAMGLFYNGNNPLDLREAYGNSDFDRTHVINFNYTYQLHNFFQENSVAGRFADGWAISGITVLQSGQPYSVIDYSGAVGSVYYGVSDGITNPIVPLAPGCTPQNAVTGFSGAGLQPALNPNCFTVPLIAAGSLGGAIPSNDPYETGFTSGQRNIFRQPWQRRADISLLKTTKLTERFSLKYTLDVFNLTNTASFDIPVDNIDQNLFFNGFPTAGTSPLPCGGSNFYACPTASGLGITNKTIGSPRQVQMSLSVLF